ncbi:hypothetical protein ACHIPZ_04155 [Antrihabitans sp. NCIMB 15449]|uniref:Uncharacterized protein n=1 Tax=Antrihabitans spumae TaxID=3373370 RepID=A0ABW7JHG4_9NOCA
MTDRMFRALTVVQEKYLRNPDFVEEEARYERVRELHHEQMRVAAELWDTKNREQLPETLQGVAAVEAARDASERAQDEVIERHIVGLIPSRLVHELKNAWAYREAEFTEPIDPAHADTGPASTQHWRQRANDASVWVETLGYPSDYDGFDPIEDVALPPRIRWTDADKRSALEKAIGIHGLEPGQWMEVEWPPTGYLTDPGHVHTTEFEPCEAHVERYDDSGDKSAFGDCKGCEHAERVVENLAKWSFTTELRISEIRFDREGEECDKEIYRDRAFAVASIEQDPGRILIGPPGQGRQW